VQLVGHVEQIQHAADNKVDQVGDGPRAEVEARDGRADDGPGPLEAEHVLQVDSAEGHFAVDEDESASLLEVTWAARTTRLPLRRKPTAPSVLLLQGQMTMPSVRKEPLASRQPTSL
jgi:hypothetical protein